MRKFLQFLMISSLLLIINAEFPRLEPNNDDTPGIAQGICDVIRELFEGSRTINLMIFGPLTQRLLNIANEIQKQLIGTIFTFKNQPLSMYTIISFLEENREFLKKNFFLFHRARYRL